MTGRFPKSLTADKPAAGLSFALAGLWWDEWTRVHESAQRDDGPEGLANNIRSIPARLPRSSPIGLPPA